MYCLTGYCLHSFTFFTRVCTSFICHSVEVSCKHRRSSQNNYGKYSNIIRKVLEEVVRSVDSCDAIWLTVCIDHIRITSGNGYDSSSLIKHESLATVFFDNGWCIMSFHQKVVWPIISIILNAGVIYVNQYGKQIKTISYISHHWISALMTFYNQNLKVSLKDKALSQWRQ